VNLKESHFAILKSIVRHSKSYTLPNPPCKQGGSKQLNIESFLISEVNLQESHFIIFHSLIGIRHF